MKESDTQLVHQSFDEVVPAASISEYSMSLQTVMQNLMPHISLDNDEQSMEAKKLISEFISLNESGRLTLLEIQAQAKLIAVSLGNMLSEYDKFVNKQSKLSFTDKTTAIFKD